MNRKGVFDAYLIFVIAAVTITFLAVLMTGFLMAMNTALYRGTANAIHQANESLSSVTSSEAKTAISNALSQAENSEAENIENMSWIYKYSWLIIILFIAIIMFMYARQKTESSKLTGGIY